MPEKIIKLFSNPWLQLFLGFLILEIVSFAVFPYAWLSRIVFIIILALAAWATIAKTENGAYLLLAELVVGGLGYLLSYPLDGGRISLRLGLFAVVGLIWLFKLIINIKKAKKICCNDRFLLLVLFFIIFCYAVINGYLNGHPIGAIFTDLNGYLYFGLIGLFLTVKLKPMRLMQILLIGSFMLGLKTLIILFLFSHGYAVVGPSLIYHWIRDTGIGEIALISAPLYRVFFQSHFYNLLALIFSAFILLIRSSEAADENIIINSISQSRWAKSLLWLAVWLNFFILVISQSRSFWVAGLFALLILIPIAAIYFKVAWQRIFIYILLIPAFALISNFAGQAVIGNFSTDFLTGRISGESGTAAVSSRMAELAPALELIKQTPLLGNGFGQMIRFRSDDPRIKNQSNPEGWTDAAAIEWGYLDLAVKTGLLGLAAYLAFLLVLAWGLFKSALQKDILSAGLLIGLLILMIVHIFTPYLNHPLGIGYILVIMALTNRQK
ncbi:MAG: O-antigen ligase family protein [Candidatus Buchananbacteria bacterium]|jgi:O-antigen ligase